MLLKEKVALIVGTKDEIGSVTAEIMAQEGAKVVVAEQNADSGQALVRKIVAMGGESFYQEMDVTLNLCHQNLINRIIKEYGRLDIAFNNVSVDGDFFPLARQSEDMVAGVIDVNFNGMWLSLKYQIEQMLKNGGGAIVNNVCNYTKDGNLGCSIYSATKSAVASMSRVAALEYARHNIRINTISPALPKRSPDNFNQDVGEREFTHNHNTPQEIAEAITWLCSDKASSITGHNLPIDVGLSA